MDYIDIEILNCLQEDATLSVAEIAKRVNLSTTPCWRRIEKLKNAGVIERQVAILNREKLNVGLTAIVGVRTSHHNPDWVRDFIAVVDEIPEVVECYRMSGEYDYMLRVVLPDVQAYDRVYKRLIGAVDIQDVTTSFAMQDIKYSTALPLDYVDV